MKPEEINAVISKECGTLRGHYCGHCREERDITNKNSTHRHGDKWFCNYCDGPLHQDMPNYFGDLNCLHEAEKILTPEQEEKYVERLSAAIMTEAYEDATADRWKKSNLASSDSTYRATAPQRATCLVKTIGKWVETKGEG